MTRFGHPRVPRKTRDQLIEMARLMRSSPTKAEELLWSCLRRRQLGDHKFRRQHIIGVFIVDFCCAERQVIVEIDGPVHLRQRDQDRERTKRLRALGYKVVRIENEEILNELEGVLCRIRALCDRHK